MSKRINKLSMAIAAIGSMVLTGCNGGSVSNGGTTNGASIQAATPAVRALFSTQQCLSGNLDVTGSGWYLGGATISITNNCGNAIDLAGTTLSFTSIDNSGGFASWGDAGTYTNDANYKISFTQGSGNSEIGTITADKAWTGKNDNGTILAHSTIVFGGTGVNTSNGGSYQLNLANSSLTINGSAPVAQTGSMTLSIDTTDAACSKTSCSNIAVIVKDNNGSTLATVNVPASSAGGIYTQKIESLNAGTYNLAASSVANTTLIYTPNASPMITANQNSNVTVKYTKAAVTGNATITLPTLVPDYTGTLQVQILNTRESGFVRNYSAKQGQTISTENLPISDATHVYKVQTQGIADPKNGKFYIESGLPTLTIKNGQTTPLTVPYKLSTTTKRTVNYTLSGLKSGDNATIYFQDGGKYAYPSYSSLTNAKVTYQFENNTSLGYTVLAGGSYKINPIESTMLINANKSIAVTFESVVTPTPSGSTVAGWPNYLAMGAVGGPNTDPVGQVNSGGDDSFGGKPVDAVFKYAGVNGNGDPGVIDPPMNAIRMATDLTEVAKVNDRASRVVIVEYTGEMSGGENFADFTNTNVPNPNKQNSTYIMARHFASLAADAQALVDKPVIKDGKKYYGSMILNPDLLGAMEQNGYIDSVNQQLPANAVNTAVDQALCLLTNTRSYTNTATPNGDGNYIYKGKTYTGTPYQILSSMLNDGYPAWSISGTSDAFWGTGIDNIKDESGNYSQMGQWFNACVANPSYDKTKYVRPNFPAGFDGWVQANNWLIRTFAAKSSGVTFAWQTNMWAVNSGFWLHNELTTSDIAAQYSDKVSNWLKTYAPSTIMNVGSELAPDYFVFDRYEMDDSAAPGSATLYSARSWDNYLIAVGQISKAFNNIPVMLWQIPGSHLPYTGETNPELFNGTVGSYIFSTAPVYFFGDSNLKADLSNLIMGNSGGTTNTAVGNYAMQSNYNCSISNCNYQQYLKLYAGKANNYNWSRDNGKLAFAASNGVFAILWGGGNTTNVIKNFSNPDDHGWLANKIKTYYQNPTYLK